MSGLASETLDAAGGQRDVCCLGQSLAAFVSPSESIAESLGSSDIQSSTSTGRSGSRFKVTLVSAESC